MTENQEVYQAVLAVTRDQLTRAMNLSAELEALLALEKKKNEQLQAEITDLTKANSKK